MPTLTLHNSMTRRREPFVPIDPGHVRMYVCGPTVYDLAHIGNARAAASGEGIDAVTARTTAQFRADMAALGNLPPDAEPRVTGHIAEIIALVERLIAQDHAYAAEGHVLFAVASFPSYGALSGRSPDELLAGARVDVAP